MAYNPRDLVLLPRLLTPRVTARPVIVLKISSCHVVVLLGSKQPVVSITLEVDKAVRSVGFLGNLS